MSACLMTYPPAIRTHSTPEIHFTRGDINDRPKLWTLLQDIDCVYHLAARVSVPESVLFPRDYNEVNSGGTATLMEAIRDAKTPRVVLTSSGAVYGDQEDPLMSETMSPHPLSALMPSPNWRRSGMRARLVRFPVLKP